MCVDALENIPPEDWPVVVANLRRALRPGGHLYLTVEEVDQQELDEAGLAVVAQDDSPGDGYGYHHLLTRAAGDPGRSG